MCMLWLFDGAASSMVVRERRVEGVGGRRAALRAEPTHPVPVDCFVPQFVWVFASRDYLPSPAGAWLYNASVSDTH